ncbi:hypothetical protein ACQJBY_027729 [Aegilops geniculata]
MCLTGGELISFSFRAERPKLAVIYINLMEEDEDDEDDEDNEDPLDEDDENPLHEAIVDQRMRLSEEEVCNLWDIILPRDDFVGVPFMTRLTSTMVDRHEMVCYTDCNNLMIYICFIVILTDEDMTILDTTKNIAYMHIGQVISSANYSIIYLCYPEQKYFTHFCVLSNCRCMIYLYNPHMKIGEKEKFRFCSKVLSRHFWAKRR